MKNKLTIVISIFCFSISANCQTNNSFTTVLKIFPDSNSQEELIEYSVIPEKHIIKIENKVTKKIVEEYCNYVKTTEDQPDVIREYYKSIINQNQIFEICTIFGNVMSIVYYKSGLIKTESHITEYAIKLFEQNQK